MVFLTYCPKIHHVWILEISQVSSPTNWCLNLISVSKKSDTVFLKELPKNGLLESVCIRQINLPAETVWLTHIPGG